MSIATDQIREQLSQGYLEESLQTAVDFLRGRHADLYDECLLHQGKLNECNRSLRLGLLRQDDVDLTRARIRYALIEIVKQLESSPANTPPTAQPKVVLVNAAPPEVVQPDSPLPVQPDGAVEPRARALLEQFFRLLERSDAATAAVLTAPLFHPSLLIDGLITDAFRQHNIFPAHQRCRYYKIPVEIVQSKPTGRKAIGPFENREEGDEYVFTLAREQETGGMPGMVRIFFPRSGAPPQITNVSL